MQIVSGLQAGEQVITEGADRLRDGARVNLPEDKPGAGGGQERKRGGKSPDGGRRSQGATQ
ncbi:hypothetical protein AYR66_09845 [Noviherbaspirillum denitrificans]|uniref:RND efflux pump membrane fusion protein barrel-sandwich domain-containing protein n=1 Tax=Noviherbaspirillum denitrificans TaxID=1968433 RepID=A0A254TAT5_9BURK|nr:hypothetical protein AYR66_09845 [Noviherbaspirillum denitrificans]